MAMWRAGCPTLCEPNWVGNPSGSPAHQDEEDVLYRCFEPFPFPAASPADRARIADLAERIDHHRQESLARDESVTVMRMYDVIVKLRAGRPLTAKDQRVATLGACASLRDLHDELDAAVAAAYGWAWPESRDVILERLVALHDTRRQEEQGGQVRWLRPEVQRAQFEAAESDQGAPLPLGPAPATAPAAGLASWPQDAVGQITALR
jgi:hypothetical protein